MTAKQYLFTVRTLRGNITRCEEAIEEIRTKMEGASAIRYDKVSVQTTKTNQMEENMIRLMSAENKLLEHQYEYSVALLRIQQEIYRLPKELHRLVLSEYFLNGNSIKYIARKHNYSVDRIYHLYLEALHEFEMENAGKEF